MIVNYQTDPCVLKLKRLTKTANRSIFTCCSKFLLFYLLPNKWCRTQQQHSSFIRKVSLAERKYVLTTGASRHWQRFPEKKKIALLLQVPTKMAARKNPDSFFITVLASMKWSRGGTSRHVVRNVYRGTHVELPLRPLFCYILYFTIYNAIIASSTFFFKSFCAISKVVPF